MSRLIASSGFQWLIARRIHIECPMSVMDCQDGPYLAQAFSQKWYNFFFFFCFYNYPPLTFRTQRADSLITRLVVR